ncbi:MAG: M20/M25/M40 family metallo-hydrolase [Bryobacterales bacterium]|nr:M20/M25/M40 family metallo-hydrolase [Bryobacterales bacterium]
MKHGWSVLFFATAALAAEPDWPRIEREALNRLQTFIRIETINPPSNVAKAAAFFADELRAAGLTPKLYPSDEAAGKINLVVRYPGRDRAKKPLLLLNHFDTVPVDAKMWDIDPFGGLLKDGFIWGRGALDMKGIGIQHLTALIEMKRAGLTPPRDIVMLTTADEESGGDLGIQWMVKHHYADIDAAYVIDEGGFGSREILAPGKLVFGIATGEKQVARLRLRASGTAAHGSQPIPDNANERLLRAIHAALTYEGRGKAHPIVAEMRANVGGTMAENKYTNAIQKNTMALTTLRAGVGDPPMANVIPSVAEAQIDCRLHPGVNAQEFMSEIKARINDPKVTVEMTSQPNDAGVSDHRTPLFAAIAKVIQRHHPGAIVTPILVPHGTDSVKLRQIGMTAYGLTPMILDLATAGTMHSDRERIPIAEFQRGVRIFFDLLQSEF